MKKMWFVGLMIGLMTTVVTVVTTMAVATPVGAISDEQKTAISQNCSSMKQSLQKLQRSDARTRVYLGSVYQIVLTNYMAPLNVRLAKNNQPNAALASDQSEFTMARDAAAQKFIVYSQALEELILIDCGKNPEQFYDKLADVRQKRLDLAAATKTVREILNDHVATVVKLQEGRNE